MSIETRALTLAYKSVISLEWKHTTISEVYGISLPTLRRIRKGQKGKDLTDEYCMKVFLEILNKGFCDDLKNHGGIMSPFYSKVFREILLAQFHIGEVK